MSLNRKKAMGVLLAFGMAGFPALADDTDSTNARQGLRIDCPHRTIAGRDSEIRVYGDAALPGCFTAKENAERKTGMPLTDADLKRTFLGICHLDKSGDRRYFAIFGPSKVDRETGTQHWNDAEGSKVSIDDLEAGLLPAVVAKLGRLESEGKLSGDMTIKLRELEKALHELNLIESGQKQSASCAAMRL